MKALRLSIAILMALSLFLSPVASLGQATTPKLIQKTTQSNNQLAAVNWCFAGDANGWNNSSTPMADDGTNGDLIAGDGVYS